MELSNPKPKNPKQAILNKFLETIFFQAIFLFFGMTADLTLK